ncbi:glycerol-3-phosphate dehydrogenase [Sphingobium sp. CCH11-B1]|jgi:glycerol-3-phosphate dehydrogenase|uniref:glycerol-3-phosphate dehydrogenase n=1 Tax=Sphingobium sp. CCH11-B1 TaxID=1768781 RepID=UPI00082EEED6|nr:glycerol-3-phosphate dehydrogenase [Sphingobium sp. CCH11-B1]MEA3390936.1 glycerol-3-phosphate dehydrogenase [Pseudomonadota bacterium]
MTSPERQFPTHEPPVYDLAVIGAGINGAGIARDAAGRGARVLVLEAGDIARGTSSASTKLIHGGLRYLEHYEFGLVRESLAERERLWRIAPHVVRPMRFVLPYRPGLRPRWLLRMGLFLYDHIGGRRALPATQTLDLRAHPAGAPLKQGFRTGFAYSDCWVDDARMVVLNLRDAADRGATVLTRTPVTSLVREDDRWRIGTWNGARHAARAVVNAAGPAVLDVLRLAEERRGRKMRLVRGSHIVVPRLFDHDYAYFFQLADGRIFFAIPYEQDFTMIGTTDADHRGSLDGVTPDDAEVAYLCKGANGYFQKQITPADVVWRFAGVRPLVDDGSGRPEAATRGYRLDLSDAATGPPLLSVFGGKLTTYRHLAQSALDLLASRMPELHSGDWTGGAPLPGGDFAMTGVAGLIEDLIAAYPFVQHDWASRLITSYGTLAWKVLGDARTLPDCGTHFSHGLTAREVDYLIDREWARQTDDILWRRSKLGLRLSAAEVENLDAYLRARREGVQ